MLIFWFSCAVFETNRNEKYEHRRDAPREAVEIRFVNASSVGVNIEYGTLRKNETIGPPDPQGVG